jgi:hypothetical protein
MSLVGHKKPNSANSRHQQQQKNHHPSSTMHCQLLAGMNNHGADCLDNRDLARAMDCFRITLAQLNQQAVQECLAVAEPVLPVGVIASHPRSPPQQHKQSKSHSPIHHPRQHDELQEPQRKKIKTCISSSSSSRQVSSSSLPNPSSALPMHHQQQPAERSGDGGGMALIQPQYPKNLEIMVSCGTTFPFSDISSSHIASSSSSASASASLEQGSSSSSSNTMNMDDAASSSSMQQQPPPLLLYSRALRLVDSPGPCFSLDPSEEETICASLTAFNLGLACHLGGVVNHHHQAPPAAVIYHPHQHQPYHHPSQLLFQAKKLYQYAHQHLLPIMAHKESTGNALLDLLFLAVCNNLALLLLLEDCSADHTTTLVSSSSSFNNTKTTTTTTTTAMAHQLYVRVLRLALAVQSSTLYGPYYDRNQQVHNNNNSSGNSNTTSIDQQFKATMTRTIDAFVHNAIQAGLCPPNAAPAA